ncbi:MAG: Fe-S cluster assembly protein SufD [Ignavibacteriae bacterium]|nr:Fe-S cluster assembly protein SufD [Ignavibacteriota bacterium]
MAELKDKIIEKYTSTENLNNGEPVEIKHIRDKAKEYFRTFGFPNRKMEDWKFFDSKPIITNDFKLVTEKQEIEKSVLNNFLIQDLKANLIVLINGEYSKENSQIITERKNLFIGSLKEGMKTKPYILGKYFAKYADYNADGFTALNTAFAPDGAFIYIPKGNLLKDPVIILNILDSRKSKVLGQPRNIIIAEANSDVHIIEEYYSIGENDVFSNVVTEIHTDENANVQYYKIQNEEANAFHVGTTQVFQERNSIFTSITLSWGGSVTRNNLNSYMNSEGIECNFKGLYFLTGKQHVDNHTLADHANPNCNSNELYKGILADESNGVFNGKIMVRQDAQKTNAYQMNKNILLSDTASINSKPQLEIFADDVKCSHGATTGQIDKEQLFYLKARGIGEKEGKKLLIFAFANEIIEDIEVPELKEYLVNRLNEKLEKL